MAFHIHRAMRTDTDLLAGGLGALLRNGAFAASLLGFGRRARSNAAAPAGSVAAMSSTSSAP